MPVNERAPVSVNRDKTKGRGGPGYGAPVGRVCRSRGGRREMAVGLRNRTIWWLFRKLRRFRGCSFFLSFGLGFRTPAARSGALFKAGV